MLSKYEVKTIKEICQIKTGKKDVNSGNPNGAYPFFTCAKENTFSDEYSFDTEALLIAGNGEVGRVTYYKGKFEAYQRTYVLDKFENLNPRFLFHILSNKLPIAMNLLKQGNTMPYIKLGMIEKFEIPYPPLDIQNQIVEELDGYQKIIDGCRQVIENYKPSIDIDSDWEMVELGSIFENITTNIKPENINAKKYKVLGLEHIEKNSGKLNINNDAFLEDVKSNKIIFEENDILYGKLRPNLNKVFLADFKGYCSTDFIVLRAMEKINYLFYSSYFLSEKFNSSVLNTVSGAQLPRTKYELIKKIKIPKPELSVQNDIGNLFYEEKKLVNNNLNLILNFEKRITNKINTLCSN